MALETIVKDQTFVYNKNNTQYELTRIAHMFLSEISVISVF